MTQTDPATLLARRFPAKRAFITGAASGLGLAMADRLARDGWTLGLLDISAANLDRAAESLRGRNPAARTFPYAGDVADERFVNASVTDFAGRAGGIDVLINNAGVAVAGMLEVTPVEDWHWIVGINLLGVVWGCRAALPLMKQQRSGLILNVASSAGFAAAPQMAAYNVTKSGVISLSETLAAEVADSGIQLSVAMPGFFRTRLLDQMRAPPDEGRLAHQLMDTSGQDPDQAAVALLTDAARGKLYLVWPGQYRLAWHFKRWFPNWFIRRVRGFRDAQARRAAGPQPG